MKSLSILLLAVPLFAQQPLRNTMITAGVGYNDDLSKHAIPWVNYMRKTATAAGFTLYTSADVQVTGIQSHPLRFQTVLTAEACPLHTLGEYLVIGACAGAGPAMNTSNVGFATGADGVVMYRFGQSQHWSVVLRSGILHSTIGGTLKPEARFGVNYEF